jgi:hypothetical protein
VIKEKRGLLLASLIDRVVFIWIKLRVREYLILEKNYLDLTTELLESTIKLYTKLKEIFRGINKK